MLLLAIDTSTRQSSVSLSTEDELYGEYTWYAENNHSVELLENIRRLMAECHFTMPQLEAIAVATGPGSFNGVRVALATAKALAFALDIPLLGISTLDAIAVQQVWAGLLCSLLEAGRSELYAATYRCTQVRREDGRLEHQLARLSEYLLLTPEQVVASLSGQEDEEAQQARHASPVLFCGEISPKTRQALQAAMREECAFASPVQSTRRASMMGMLAFQRLHAGERDDPLLLDPLYLRRPSITTSSRKQPLFGSVSQHQGQRKTERGEGALRH